MHAQHSNHLGQPQSSLSFYCKPARRGPKRLIHVTTATWACSKKLRQIRAACVEEVRSPVLNFVINPLMTYDLPFFGADLVTLLAGHLLALDLQPALKTDPDHTEQVWSRLLPLFKRWQERLPHGGPIPERLSPIFHQAFYGHASHSATRGMPYSGGCDASLQGLLSLYLELVDLPKRCARSQ